jgi:prevent-host-death family protein
MLLHEGVEAYKKEGPKFMQRLVAKRLGQKPFSPVRAGICPTDKLADKLVYMDHKTTVGTFDAKTHLNGLLKRVSKGETIRITRRGVPIAKLVPADAGEKKDPDQLVREIREFRKSATLGKITIRELINEGRHY